MVRTSLLTLAALASCGRDSAVSDDDQATVQQASDKQAEAIALATASPCNTVAQCADLNFVIPNGHCSTQAFHPNSLASHAVDIAPPPQACAASIELPPGLACVANTCQVVLPGS